MRDLQIIEMIGPLRRAIRWQNPLSLHNKERREHEHQEPQGLPRLCCAGRLPAGISDRTRLPGWPTACVRPVMGMREILRLHPPNRDPPHRTGVLSPEESVVLDRLAHVHILREVFGQYTSGRLRIVSSLRTFFDGRLRAPPLHDRTDRALPRPPQPSHPMWLADRWRADDWLVRLVPARSLRPRSNRIRRPDTPARSNSFSAGVDQVVAHGSRRRKRDRP